MKIEFYDANTADDSDPDPTWVLNNVPFSNADVATFKMVSIFEMAFSTAPIYLRRNAEHADGWDVLRERHDDGNLVFLGVMFILEDSE